MKLTEFSQKLSEIQDLIFMEEEQDELAYLSAEWDGLNAMREEKIGNWVSVIKDLEDQAGNLKERAKIQADRARSLANRAESMKSFLASQMTPGEKFDNGDHRLSWRKSEACILTVSPEAVPEQYLKPQPPKVDLAGIKADLKAGATYDFALIEERQNLVIK